MRQIAKALGIVLAAALFAAPCANADFGLDSFSVSFHKGDGSPETLAGSHPFGVTTSLRFETEISEGGKEVPIQDVRSLRFELPPGFIGSTTAASRCSTADFLTLDTQGYPACSNGTAIGVSWTEINNPGEPFAEPVYNLVPPPGVAAKIGFYGNQIPITAEIGINGKAPHSVIAGVFNVPQVVPIYGSSLQIWGVPAAHSHDPYRGRCLKIGGVPNYGDLVSNGICNTGAEEQPFITLPRSCGGELTSSYKASSWQQPEIVVEGISKSPGMVGCSDLGFSPTVAARPTSTSTDSASGLDFGIEIDDEGLTSPTGRAQSDIKDMVVKLPAGITFNPSAANGLSVCSFAAYESEALTSVPSEGCPEASRVGELEVETPLLPEGKVLRGEAFIASQYDNPFGSLFAIYIVIRDPELGIVIKQAGKVEPSEERGPNAGQVVSFFSDIPQVPFSDLRFRFKQGARAPLVTPPTCGSYAIEAQFTPWIDPGRPRPVTPATFDISSGVAGGACPAGSARPFQPGFIAGSVNNSGGAYSPFNMRLTRLDGEQEITRLDAVLPKGLTGKLTGVARCPDTAIAAAKAKTGREELANPSCPVASEIGRVLGGSGVGNVLTYVPGKVYLGGPVGKAPFSAIVIAPAVAGPFDVGTVVAREALNVNPDTAEVSADGSVSEPLPSFLKGVPTKLREVRIQIDRPNFMLNPTSCAAKQTKATLFGSFLDPFSSADDAQASAVSRYQAASCASLRFKPNLTLRLKGGTKRGAHPAIRAQLTYPPGRDYANIRKAVVTFPHSMFLEQAHIRTVCTRVQFAANNCPAGSIYGKVQGFTPLLDQPVQGNVYLRSSSNPLPDLVFAFRGEVDFNAVARVDSVNASLRTSFESIPDVPISKVIVEMQGGKKGLIVNSRNLCARKSRVKAAFTGHNGKTYEQRPAVKAQCKKVGKKFRRQ